MTTRCSDHRTDDDPAVPEDEWALLIERGTTALILCDEGHYVQVNRRES